MEKHATVAGGIMVLFIVAPLVAVLVALAVHHRLRVRNRWVSPYTGFRVAAARVTRTTDSPFDIAGAHVIHLR